MKQLANIVTSSRIVGAIALFCMNSITPLFIGVYIFCGFTDLIDGPIARKTSSSSLLGAALDTIGDVMTYFALTKILIQEKIVPLWILIWFACTLVLFLGVMLISKKRFNKFYLPHTYLGKIFGGAIFVLPIMIQFMPAGIWLSVICSISTIHAFEQLYVQTKSTSAMPFVPSVFHVK